MSLEEGFIKLVGIIFIGYHCARVLLVNAIKNYTQIRVQIQQSIQEIQAETSSEKLEYEFNQMKGK